MLNASRRPRDKNNKRFNVNFNYHDSKNKQTTKILFNKLLSFVHCCELLICWLVKSRRLLVIDTFAVLQCFFVDSQVEWAKISVRVITPEDSIKYVS